jgi:hypothetical protein
MVQPVEFIIMSPGGTLPSIGVIGREAMAAIRRQRHRSDDLLRRRWYE